MKRFVCVLLLALLSGCGWIKQKAFVYFYDKPVTQETSLSPKYEFELGQQVYYLFFSKKRLENKYVRVQLFKIHDLVPQGGAEMMNVKDYRLMKDEVYYQTDYFVPPQPGRYIIQVYNPEDLNIPLARGEFKVR